LSLLHVKTYPTCFAFGVLGTTLIDWWISGPPFFWTSGRTSEGSGEIE
jgi:hypothetical protein